MFDIGFDELLIIAIVAIIVIGPKDMPQALRTVGRWIGKVRRMSTHFRSGIDAMIREAELEEMEKKWKEQNERIMAELPSADLSSPSSGSVPAANPAPSGQTPSDPHQPAAPHPVMESVPEPVSPADPHVSAPIPAPSTATLPADSPAPDKQG